MNTLAQNSNITIASLEDFETICQNLGINDSNVDDYDGQFCFIEIGSTLERCRYDAELTNGYDKWDNDGSRYYNEGQYYFKQEHPNVLHLEFDDNISIGKDGDVTAVALSPHEWRDGHDATKLPNVSSKGFKYAGAKGFSIEMAEQADDFIEDNIQKNPDIKFVIHCRAGQSRSAAMGYYIAKRLKLDIAKYLQEYDREYKYQDKEGNIITANGSQFRFGHNRKGHMDTMNNRVSAMMDAVRTHRSGGKSNYDKYKKQGYSGSFSVAADDPFHQDLRNYAGTKDNPHVTRSIKGYTRMENKQKNSLKLTESDLYYILQQTIKKLL